MGEFHEVTFPIDIALGSRGGPQRKTDVVTLGSGKEERNQRWYHSKRRYDAGYGIKTLSKLSEVVAFFEERRGMLYGFRWHDRSDFSSSLPGTPVSALDQTIGIGDGANTEFQLQKTYGAVHAPYQRDIKKPVDGSVLVAIDGNELSASDFSVDTATGLVSVNTAYVPSSGAGVTAGFRFDVPVRFDTDYLDIDIAAFEAGQIPELPVTEIFV